MPRCEDCLLHKTCMSVKIPMERGSDSPRILFVGEAPGREEDQLGRPFIGASGQLLRDVLSEILPGGVKPWITNAVKCRPPQNKLPPKEAFDACDKYLWEDISACDPDIVIPLGAAALKAVLRKSGITALRGRRFDLKYAGKDGKVKTCYACPTYHPAYLLRNPGELAHWIEDLQRGISVDETRLPTVNNIFTRVSLSEFKILAKQAKWFTYDIESNNLLNWAKPSAFITQLGFCTKVDSTYYVAGDWPDVFTAEDWAAVKALFADKKLLKIGHNAKFDMAWLKSKLGIVVEPPHFCTMTAYYIGVSEELSSSLKTLAYIYTDIGGYEEAYVTQAAELPAGYSVQDFLARSEEDRAVEKTYNFCDCYVTAVVFEKLKPVIDSDEGFSNIFYNVLMPVYPVLVDMEIDGIAVDVKRYKEYSAEAIRREARLCYEAWELMVESGVRGYDLWYDSPDDVNGYKNKPKRHKSPKLKYLNLNAPAQLRDILYGQLKFPVLGLTPKAQDEGWRVGDNGIPLVYCSTGKKTLDELMETRAAKNSPLLKTYRAWKTVNTIYKMFLKPLPKYVDSEWVAHPKYTPMKDPGREYGEGRGTVTGRLSSADPNFQQLPRNPVPDDDGTPSPLEGLAIRNLYCSRFENGSIVSADFSQIELRWAAILGDDKLMIHIFNEGGDIHRATAAEMFGITVEEVVKEQRRAAKAINFGILYGKQKQSLAKELGISEVEAQDFIDRYFDRFRGVKRYIDNVHKQVKRHGFVRTYFGRMRRLSGAMSDELGIRTAALREAVNSNPQGSASDMALISLARIKKEFTKRKMRSVICGNIHDALEFDTPPEETKKTARIVKLCMEDWDEYNFPIPILVDVEIGPSLGEVAHVEL